MTKPLDDANIQDIELVALEKIIDALGTLNPKQSWTVAETIQWIKMCRVDVMAGNGQRLTKEGEKIDKDGYGVPEVDSQP